MAWAGAGRSWIEPVLLAVLLVGAGAAVWAQTAEPAAAAGQKVATGKIGATGSIDGRLTDLHSAALPGATVVVRNTATGAEARTTTAKNGSYRFAGLAAGEYTLDAESPQMGHGRLEGIYVSGGHEARVQAAMDFEPFAAQPVEVAAHETRPAAAPAVTAASRLNPQPEPTAGNSPPPTPDSTLPAVETGPPAPNPLQQLAAMEQTKEKPATVAAVVAATVESETLRGLPLRDLVVPAAPPQPPSAFPEPITKPGPATGGEPRAIAPPTAPASYAAPAPAHANPAPAREELPPAPVTAGNAAPPIAPPVAPATVQPAAPAAGAPAVPAAAPPAVPAARAPVEAVLYASALSLVSKTPMARVFSLATGGKCRDGTTYYYKVAANAADGTTVGSTEVAITTGNSGGNANTILVGSPTADLWPAGAKGLIVGGRDKSGGELRIGTVTLPQTYFADTCTTTPRGAMPSATTSQQDFEVARVDKQADPATPVVATTLTAAELQALPAAGRRWQDFVLDTPTASTAEGGTAQTSLRGAGQEPVETTIDGVSTRMAFGGQGNSGPGSQGPGSNGQGGSSQNGMGQAWAGGRGAPVAEAAIREVQTAAGNAEAEGARTAGGQLNVATARGTIGLHGQGFLFDRENAWGAQNPFTEWVKQTAPATLTTPPVFTAIPYTPSDRETVWGVGLGSEIRRRKLFWFGALDSYQRNDPGLAMVKEPAEFFAQPSNDQLQVLSARLGMSSVNPVAEGLKAYLQMLTTLDGLLGPAPRTASQWVGFGRVDWQAAERHRFTVEEIGAHWNSPGGGLTRVSEAYGTNSFGSSDAGEELLLGRWEAFLTRNLLAVFQGSAGRMSLAAHAETPSAFEQTLLSVNAWGQLPQIAVDSRYGFTIGNPSRFGTGSYPDERVFQAQESVDWVRGNLLVKSGFQLSHNGDSTTLLRNQTGTYHYSSVENFASDALVYDAFGLGGELNSLDQHNCDQTGKVWRDSGGNLRGLGSLPCYSYYSQVIGPNNWSLSTNDWAGFSTAQWQPARLLVVSGGLRWELEQMPPPLATLANPDLPLAGKAPSAGSNWGPRFSLALGSLEKYWPMLRLGYGMYFGRTENATLETALTQTGSPNGDQSFFLRPTDNLNAGGAPPFPYVLRGAPGSVVKPGAVEFAAGFRNPEVHQAVAAVEEELPGHVQVTAAGLMSLGRRLPVSIDTNFDPAVNPGTITYDVVNCPATFHGAVVTCTGNGPIKSQQITVPFYASWPSATSPTGFAGRLNPNYQQITQIMSRANSTYEAAMLKVVRYGRRGLSLHAHYTYAHAMDWNPNESTLVAGSDVLDPADFSLEYGTSNLDVRHSAAVMAAVETPWKLDGKAGWLANGWMVSGIGEFRSGLPYTMRVTGSLPECIVSPGITACAPPSGVQAGTGDAIVGLAPGINGSGGDNRVYGVGNDNVAYNLGRNSFRYPATWKADLRVGKNFDLGKMREVQLLIESFNLFNHQNVTEIETTGYYVESGTAAAPPRLNFLNSFTLEPPIPGLAQRSAFGQPLNINATNFYRERQIQVGVRVRF